MEIGLILIAKLCLPPRPAEADVYYGVVATEVLQAPRQFILAGMVHGRLPARVRVIVHYWKDPLHPTRRITLEGNFSHKEDLERAIFSAA